MDDISFNIQPINSHADALSHDLYYPDDCNVKPLVPGELDRDRLSLTFALGFPQDLHLCYCFVSPSTIAYPSGNVLVLLNTATLEQQLIPGPRSGGISSVAIHPDKSYIAVGERHVNGPNIYIYSYPEFRLYRVLRGGGDLAINQLAFSQADQGKFLASVAGEPDYSLTVWDWRNEHVTLRAKSFSQDVFQVTFSPINPLTIVTSGAGHIKFWNMASTFTGLKLQGVLGKFGATELCDIPCFAFLPNGKVLTGTDVGILLVWDGNTIESEVSRKLEQKCHDGSIEYLAIAGGEIITAGQDGYIRTWDLDALETTRQNESKSATAVQVMELDPLDEYSVGKDVKIISMLQIPVVKDRVPSAQPSSVNVTKQIPFKYIIRDSSGIMWRVDMNTRSSEQIGSYPSGSINAIDTCSCPVHHLVSMAGTDGTVRIMDPVTRNLLAVKNHSVPCTCTRYLPQILDNSGCSLMAGFADGSVRFFRHTLPNAGVSSITMVRTHAFRPHTNPICSLVLSSDSTVLTTATNTGDMFFFTVCNTNVTFDKTTVVSPVGFISLGISIQSLIWASETSFKCITDRICGRYLLVTSAGELIILAVNLNKHYEHSHNFLIPATDYQINTWDLNIYESTLPENESSAEIVPNESNPTPKTPQGDEGKNRTGSHGNAKEEKPVPIPVTFQITQSLYIEQDHIVVAIESSNGVIEMRSCLLTDGKISRLLLRLEHFASISHLTFSTSAKLLLAGCSDGTIYYRPVSFDDDMNLGNTGGHDSHMPSHEHFWRAHTHAGKTVGLQATFDDSIYISASSDGSIFVFKSPIDDLIERALLNDGIALPVLEEGDELPNKYTIQEAKMKMRIDQDNIISDERKAAKKLAVYELQQRLNALIIENKELPIPLRLDGDNFHVDPGLEETLAHETSVKVEKVRNQMMMENERIESLLRKLYERFYDPEESQVMVIPAFQNKSTLCSFKIEKSRVHDLQEKTHAGDPTTGTGHSEMNGNTKTPLSTNSLEAKSASIPGQKVTQVVKANQAGGKSRGKSKGKSQPHVDQNSRAEQRRRLKAERLEQWKMLVSRKPSTVKDDPRDDDAFRYAENHMGDYKLKRDKNYIVPENERVNAEMKHKQLLLLQISLDRIMDTFNDKVKALNQKRSCLECEITGRNSHINEAEQALTELRSKTLEVKPATSIEDIQIHESVEYRSETCRLEDLIHCLQQENAEDMLQFDRAHQLLCHERLGIETDMNSGKIRLNLLFREWRLLKEFEKHDTQLSEKLATKKLEKADIDQKINDIQSVISIKRTEIETTTEARKAIDVKLTDTIGESSKHEELLRKIFHRKIKRRRRKNNQVINSETRNGDVMQEEEESDVETDSDENEDSDDQSEDEEFSDDCPQGCDPQIHAAVISFREQRLDLEEFLFNVQKIVDGLKKDYDLFSKKEKIITAALRLTEQEIQDFQSQKQQKLNELDVVVPLAMDQIEYFEDSLDNALVFSSNGIETLCQRIVEIEQETEQVHKDYAELKREHVNLLLARKEKRLQLIELENKCIEVQMLKFGRTVDLDRLEKIGVNKLAEDLRQQISEKERHHTKEIEEWDDKIAALKREITDATIVNTSHLENMYDLNERRKSLEQNLNKKQFTVACQYTGPSQKEIEEHSRLVSTFHQQAQQIESLKRELAQLLRKPSESEIINIPQKKRKNHNALKEIDNPYVTVSEIGRPIKITGTPGI